MYVNRKVTTLRIDRSTGFNRYFQFKKIKTTIENNYSRRLKKLGCIKKDFSLVQ